MNVLILNGSRNDMAHSMRVNKILEGSFSELSFDTETILLRNIKDLKHCVGCFGCWEKTPGICVYDGPHRDINRKIINCDILVYLTPLTFGGYSSEIKKMIEFQLGLLLPDMKIIKGETHHKKRYKKYPSVLAIAVSSEGDKEEEDMFQKLIDRHALNWYPPKHKALIVYESEDDTAIKIKLNNALQEMRRK